MYLYFWHKFHLAKYHTCCLSLFLFQFSNKKKNKFQSSNDDDSEEAIVMANLRKRVAACDLERKRPVSIQSDDVSEINTEQTDNRPLLPKVSYFVFLLLCSHSLNNRSFKRVISIGPQQRKIFHFHNRNCRSCGKI